MNEVKAMLKRIAVYYLLLAINIIPCASLLPDSFPTRNVSTIYLLILSVCLVMYYNHRVLRGGRLSAMMQSLSWMGLLLILLRGIKYSAFSEVGALARHTWYLYYVPMLLMPLFFFYIALLVSPKENARIAKGWYSVLAITLVFILLVLTNDSHQLMFRFAPQFADWDSYYSYGWLFYALTVWQYALHVAAILILVVKCRIGTAKKYAWIILIPFSIGIGMNLLLVSGKMPKIHGTYILELPEALIFTVAIVLECCMHLGLIPTNTDYGKLFRRFSIRAQITDLKGTPIYSSNAATPLSAAQFAMENGARIGTHTILHKMPIPGGFGFWQDDISELDRLNEELAQAKEELAQEAELIRLRNELKERQTVIEQRTQVYDTIAERTQKQSQSISHFAALARRSEDIFLKQECRNRILLTGAYIKRYANLMLLSGETGSIESGELALSVSEVLRYLNYCGIPSELFHSAHCTVNAEAALAVFEAFETLLDTNFSCLRGTFVNLSEQGKSVSFKLTLENLSEPLSGEMLQRLAAVGVLHQSNQEDNVDYVAFCLPKGGAGA